MCKRQSPVKCSYSQPESSAEWGAEPLQDAPKHFSMISTPSEAEWKHCRKTFNVAFSPAAMRKVSMQAATYVCCHPSLIHTQHVVLQRV